MAFQKPGMSVSRAFSGGGNRSGFKAQPRDRLAEVLGYNTGQSTITARDVDSGKLMDVIVDPARVQEITQRAASKPTRESTATWQGHLIDENMAKAIPVGHRMVLERTTPRGRPVNRDGQEYMQLQAGYIRGLSDESPEKAFRGIITAEAYERRFTAVQVWEGKAYDVGQNEGDIVAKFDEMDAIAADEAAGGKPVGLGMALRAIVPLSAEEVAKGNENGPRFEVIDTTEAYHWVAAQKDEQGNKISDGHHMGKKEASELVGEYISYLNDRFPEGCFGPGIDFAVEVMFFRNYKASIKSYGMAVPERGPLSYLVTTPTKCAQDDENFVFGRNFAVDGIVALTRDQAPKKQGEPWIERNMADHIYANGFRAPVSSMVRTADDARVRLHPGLVAPRQEYTAQSSAAPAASAPASAPASSPAPAGDGFTDDGFGGGNAFEDAMRGDAPAAAPAPSPAPAASGGTFPTRRRPA